MKRWDLSHQTFKYLLINLKQIGLKDVRSEGYSFQIEMKYRGVKNDFKVKEVPITFDERREGASKMSLKIVIEAFYRVWQIRFLV